MKNYSKELKNRFVYIFYITLVLYTALIIKLVNIQAYEHEKFVRYAQGQHIGKIEIHALRGSIVDRNGTVMAFSLSSPSIAVNPREVENPDKTAFYLSLILGKKKEDIFSIITLPSTFAWVERKIDEKQAKEVEKLNLPGVFILQESTGKRFYPKQRIASHVVGYTGIDDQGLEGVEASYDEILSGKSGVLEAEMDQVGRLLPQGDSIYIPSVPGKTVHLTIDETVQYIVEHELEKQVKRFKAAGGSVILYKVKTGEILALANYPDYLPSRGLEADRKMVRNGAVCDNYEPGSTFKVITAAAAFDSGISYEDQFYSGQSLEVGGYSLRNANDGIYSLTGQETVEGIITYSFNVGCAELGLRIGKDSLYKHIDAFGFGKLTGIDLSGETEGILVPGKYWQPINLATISYGQGIAVTPLQMVQAYGAIANGGVMLKPHLVSRITDPDGKVVREIRPQVVATPISPESSYLTLRCLKNVVREGTGRGASIPGYLVGGKTGTANVVENGVYSSNKYIASFVGVIPADNPELVMFIKINEPKGVIWGGAVAAPLCRNIGTQILWRLGIQPTEPIEEEKTADLTH